MAMIRTFIAVEITEQMRQRSQHLVARLGGADVGVKWVQPQNLHLTMKFLGNVDERSIADVCSAVAEAARTVQPFELLCRGVGAFPRPSQPRTIWVGVQQGKEEARQLHRAIEKAVARLGYPKEHRQFQPHLTLGRVRSRKDPLDKLAAAIQAAHDVELGRARIDEVVVFSSQLQPGGPIYHALSRAPLG